MAPSTEEIRAIIYPEQKALDEYCRVQGKGPLSVGETELLLRAEVYAACERRAGYKWVRKFTIREDEFPKTTTRKIKRFIVEASVAANGGDPSRQGNGETYEMPEV